MKRMKKILGVILAACLLAVMAGCAGAAPPAPAQVETPPASPPPLATTPAQTTSGEADEQPSPDRFANLPEVKWRLSSQGSTGTSTANLARFIGEEVTKRSGGKFFIEVYTDAVLYTDRECFEALIAGAIEAGIGTYATLARFADYLNVVNLPFLVTNWEDLENLVFGDDFAGARKLLTDSIYDGGIIPVATFSQGLRHVTNNIRPINTIEDYVGIKIRIMQNDVYISTFQALGAYPVPMAAAEIMVSLQQGTIDGQENSLCVIFGDGSYEFQKYLSLTGHAASMLGVFASPGAWEALPVEYQELYTEVAREGCKLMFDTSRQNEPWYKDFYVNYGVEVNDLSGAAIEEMRRVVMEEVWPLYESQYAEFLAYFK